MELIKETKRKKRTSLILIETPIFASMWNIILGFHLNSQLMRYQQAHEGGFWI